MHANNLLQTAINGIGIFGIHRRTRAVTGKQRKTVLLQESPLAGFQHHRASGVWCFLRVGETLRLVREHHNPHDPNAIAVYFKNDHLGYVPRGQNQALAQMMDQGVRLEARIIRLLEDEDPWRRVRFEVVLRK